MTKSIVNLAHNRPNHAANHQFEVIFCLKKRDAPANTLNPELAGEKNNDIKIIIYASRINGFSKSAA